MNWFPHLQLGVGGGACWVDSTPAEIPQKVILLGCVHFSEVMSSVALLTAPGAPVLKEGRALWALDGLCNAPLPGCPCHSAGLQAVLSCTRLPSRKVWGFFSFFSKRRRKHLVIWELVFVRERSSSPTHCGVTVLCLGTINSSFEGSRWTCQQQLKNNFLKVLGFPGPSQIRKWD